MEWNLDDARPIWPQIKAQLMREIAAGHFSPGEPFPTVRELAEDAKVNRNTMQRALAELETEGLVITNRTAGRIVTSDRDLIAHIRGKIAQETIRQFREEMAGLGFSLQEVMELMQKEQAK